MRSSAILVAALVGVASAGIPKWPLQWSNKRSYVSSDVASTSRLYFGPGPVSVTSHTGVSFPTASGGIYPSGGSQKHHSEQYHHRPSGSGAGPTSRPGKHHHRPSGSGAGPTATGYRGSPAPTQSPHTTTITKTSDVTSEWLIAVTY